MKAADVGLAVMALATTLAVATPNYLGLGNRIEPMMLGVPFSLVWNVAWICVSFVGLLAYHLVRKED